VSTLEDRIRDAFRADAETVRPEAIPGPPAPPRRPAPGRPGLRRRRVLIPVAAAAAVIALVVGLSVATPLLHRQEHQANPPGPGLLLPSGQPAVPHGPLPKPVLGANASRGVPASAPAPGVPPFYVTVYVPPVGGVDYIVVRDTATGKITGRINPPGSAVFAGLAATGGDRTFITAIDPDTGCSPVQLYQFRLNHRGVPGPLEPLHITLPGGVPQGEGDLAITPDGRTIAYKSGVCNTLGSEVGVINLATRQVRVWAVPENVRDPIPEQIISLSLSADGRWLGYTIFPMGARLPWGGRILRTTSPAGSLAKYSRVVSRTALWTALSGDGTSLYYCAVSPYSGGTLPNIGTLTYGTLSLADGGQHVIASWASVDSPQCYASLDPVGNYLLVQLPTSVPSTSGGWSRPAILDRRTGQLTGINAPAFYGPFDIAW
jgi:hypothetical protein